MIDRKSGIAGRLFVAMALLTALTLAASAQTAPPADPGASAVAPGATALAPTAIRDAGAESASVPSPSTLAPLPRDLSPWGMFSSATLVVKAVMALLALASVATWTVALAKGWELFAAKRELRRQIAALARADSLGEAVGRLRGQDILETSALAAVHELEMSGGLANVEGVKERIASRLERLEAAAGRRMARGTGVLATTGAIAPFVGLFGTVWGIMNSFVGISKQHTTNLAVVAPGIAEALLATAMGLVAAIPAVIVYNMASRSIAARRAFYADGSAEILRLASRDLDRAAQTASSPVAAKTTYAAE